MLLSPRLFLWLLLAGWLLRASTAPAQSAGSWRSIRTISPADTSYADLEFLRQELGPARVVMLGEPTHGEGNVFEAKIRLAAFLHRRLGFTTLAFESGFYELHRAQQHLAAGTPAAEALEASVYPIWTQTQEFQALLPLLGPGRLRLAGFDNQLSGDYSDDMLDELQTFLKPVRGAEKVNYDYLDEVVGLLKELALFPPNHTLAAFEQQLALADQLLQGVAQHDAAPARRAEAGFWRQNLRSLGALARDYALHDPGAKGADDFRAADSNPRDAQMADNLLWYLRQHPGEKVICWGALPHLANRAAALQNPELQRYQPMGSLVKAALGDEAVYVLGTLSGGGEYGFVGGAARPVPPPAAGSLEAEARQLGYPYAFRSLRHPAAGPLTTAAFEYTPLTGQWSAVVDGFLFLATVQPPRPRQPDAAPLAPTTPTTPTTPATARPVAPPPLRRPAAAAGLARTLRGTVYDAQTGVVVPFASVAVPALGRGVAADANGNFALPLPAGAVLLQVSSLGYEPAAWPVGPAGAAALRIALRPAPYQLADVQVRGQLLDPRAILKKAIRAIPANYARDQGYRASFYAQRTRANFDSLDWEVEYTGTVYEPAGARRRTSGHRPQVEVQRVNQHYRSGAAVRSGDTQSHGGFGLWAVDVIGFDAVFEARNLGKYHLRLDSVQQEQGEPVYVVSFETKKASHRSTGTYLQSGYGGKLYIQQRDYAVLRYDAWWQTDTATINAVARHRAGQHNLAARLYNQLFADYRSVHSVRYARGADGRYHLRSSQAQGIQAGRPVQSATPYRYFTTCNVYFTDVSSGTAPPAATADHGAVSEIMALQKARSTSAGPPLTKPEEAAAFSSLPRRR